MGYSYAVICKNTKAAKKMLSFLLENFAMANDEFRISDDLSYCHFKNQVGIDHGPISDESRYVAMTLLRWIAIRVGKLKQLKHMEDEAFLKSKGMDFDSHASSKIPFINYDSEYDLMVLKRREWETFLPKDLHYLLTDDYGVRDLSPHERKVFKIFSIPQTLILDTALEMERLAKLWEKSCS